MLLDFARERDVCVLLGADGLHQLQLHDVLDDAEHSAAGRSGADVHKEHLALVELGDASLRGIAPHAEQPAEEEEVDLDLEIHVGQRAGLADDLSDKTVGLAEDRVEVRADADETAGDGVLQVDLLGVQRDHARVQRRAREGRVGLHDETGTDFDFIAKTDNTLWVLVCDF